MNTVSTAVFMLVHNERIERVVGPAGVVGARQINEVERQTDLSARTDTKGVSGTLANLSAPVYPIIVAEWQRNSREIIRVALDQYQGREIVDARAWWRDDEGSWRPGRSGLTLSLKHLPALADGLVDALQRARALGLVESATTATNNTKDKTAAERQRRFRERQRNAAAA
jgi:Transcriptional Coactivator p15 (PC4)